MVINKSMTEDYDGEAAAQASFVICLRRMNARATPN